MKYIGGDTTLETTVMRATLRGELRRFDAIGETDTLFPGDFVRAGMDIIHAALVAASPAGSLVLNGVERPWPPTFDDYLDLDREIIDAWAEDVWRLNPDWKPSLSGETPEAEKKDEPTPESAPLIE